MRIQVLFGIKQGSDAPIVIDASNSSYPLHRRALDCEEYERTIVVGMEIDEAEILHRLRPEDVIQTTGVS